MAADPAILAVPDPELVNRIIRRVETFAQPAPRERDRLSASQAHRCQRALVLETASTRPVPVGIKGLVAFSIGHAVHELIQMAYTTRRECTRCSEELRFGASFCPSCGHPQPSDPDPLAQDFGIEEEWWNDYCIGHSDLNMRAESLMIDFKTAHVDDFYSIALSGQPKDYHLLQDNWYGHMAGCETGAIVYVNKNGRLTDAMKRQKKWTQESDLFAAFRFRIDSELAREYDHKGREILAHVEAKTLPEYQDHPDCGYCPVATACSRALRREAGRV